MEKIKKEVFLEWVKKHDWFLIQEAGLKAAYLTPTGNIVMTSYTVTGELETISMPQPMPMTQRPGPITPFDFKGGAPFPFPGAVPPL